MATYFNSSRSSLFLPIIISLAVACNNKADEKTTEKKPATDTSNAPQTAQSNANFTGVTLDVLYTDSASFNKAPDKRTFFVLTYIEPDIITLSGFATAPSGGGSFPDPPIVLKKGGSMLIPSDTTYVGNVKLDKSDVQQVKTNIKTLQAGFVLFTPSLSPTYPNHIQYTIGYTNDDPGVNKNPLVIPTATTVIANPSPPKQL
jgi:hypothetical protein